ncbi:hypothetical protein EMIT0P228_140130 [Pseudomonas brassicacearum]
MSREAGVQSMPVMGTYLSMLKTPI